MLVKAPVLEREQHFEIARIDVARVRAADASGRRGVVKARSSLSVAIDDGDGKLLRRPSSGNGPISASAL